MALLPTIAAQAVLGAGFVALGVGAWLATRAWRTARLISATPPTPISALSPGLHEVQGAVHGTGCLTAPLSGRPCLYWRFLIEQRRANTWEALVDRREAVPSWLDDGGGRLEVDPRAADVILSREDHAVGGIFGVPSAELSRVLGEIGEVPANLVGPYVRYREEVFADGDRLHAVGTVVEAEGGWHLRSEGDVHVLSDRDEAEVVRYEERLALRWVGLAVIGLGLVVWVALELLA